MAKGGSMECRSAKKEVFLHANTNVLARERRLQKEMKRAKRCALVMCIVRMRKIEYGRQRAKNT